MNIRLLLIPVVPLWFCACGNDASAPTPVTGGGQPQQVERVKSGEMFDDDSAEMLSRYGSNNPMFGAGGAQAASESGAGDFQQFQGAIAQRDFAAASYDKKAFWGDKGYAAKVYEGDLDGSRHAVAARQNGQGARENTMMSRDGGKAYAAREFESGRAREAGGERLPTTADARTVNQAERYRQPDIQDWSPQRALSVEDTKGMLGR